jgi:hypothetical protein
MKSGCLGPLPPTPSTPFALLDPWETATVGVFPTISSLLKMMPIAPQGDSGPQ